MYRYLVICLPVVHLYWCDCICVCISIICVCECLNVCVCVYFWFAKTLVRSHLRKKQKHIFKRVMLCPLVLDMWFLAVPWREHSKRALWTIRLRGTYLVDPTRFLFFAAAVSKLWTLVWPLNLKWMFHVMRLFVWDLGVSYFETTPQPWARLDIATAKTSGGFPIVPQSMACVTSNLVVGWQLPLPILFGCGVGVPVLRPRSLGPDCSEPWADMGPGQEEFLTFKK